jgi:hypothetical protein
MTTKNMKLLGRGLLLAVVALLAGCATQSQFNGYVSASSEEVRTVQQGGWSEDVYAQVVITTNPLINEGRLPAEAVKIIGLLAANCQWQVDAQLPGAGQSAVSGAVPYGLAGAVGTGAGAVAAFKGAVQFSQYAKYGGIAYLGAGSINGMVSGSYAMSAAKGDCTRQHWEEMKRDNPNLRGVAVTVAYAGKRMGGSAPPTLDRGYRVAPQAPEYRAPPPALDRGYRPPPK